MPRTATRPVLVELDPAPALDVSLRTLQAELSDSFFELDSQIRMVLLTVLAGQHAFIVGPPGVAKSAVLEAVCSAVDGARYFRVLLDRQMDKSELFGQIDQPAFLREGVWRRDTTDTLADCHLALLDEVGHAGPNALNPTLTALNERRFRPGNAWVDIPLISAFGASNTVLEESMAALWDRFLVRLVFDDLAEQASFVALLSRPTAPPVTRLSLLDLQRAVALDVPAVRLDAPMVEAVRELRAALAADGVTASPRRWVQMARLLRAAAFLDGRDQVAPQDLAVLSHTLWNHPDERDAIARTVLSFLPEATRLQQSLSASVRAVTEQVHARADEPVAARAAYGAQAVHELRLLHGQVRAELTETDGADLREQVGSALTDVFYLLMNTPVEQAASMAADGLR